MRAIAWLVLAFVLPGCAGIKSYPTDASGNFSVRSRVDSGVRAVLHVHRVTSSCDTEYRGTVSLDRSPVAISLPAGEPAWLVVSFDTSSLFSGKRTSSFGTLLAPRPGYRYQLSVRYHEDIYDLVLRESDPRTGAQRVLPRRGLDGCGRSG